MFFKLLTIFILIPIVEIFLLLRIGSKLGFEALSLMHICS